MTVHERRLSHEMIELKNEQQKVVGEIEALKTELGTLKSKASSAVAASSQQTVEALVAPGSPLLDGLKNVFSAPGGAPGGSKTSPSQPSQPPPAETIETEVFAKELVDTFTQMESRLSVEVARLQGQLNSMRQQNFTAITSPEAETPEPGQNQMRAVTMLREETQVWKIQHEKKFAEINDTLEAIKNELPLLALKTGRLALRAIDMSDEDRNAALEAVELKEGLTRQSLSKRSDGNITPKDLTPRSEFKTAVQRLGTFDSWEKISNSVDLTRSLGTGSATPGNTTPTSRGMMIADENPRLAEEWAKRTDISRHLLQRI